MEDELETVTILKKDRDEVQACFKYIVDKNAMLEEENEMLKMQIEDSRRVESLGIDLSGFNELLTGRKEAELSISKTQEEAYNLSDIDLNN